MSLSYKLDSSEYGWWANLVSWLSIDNLTVLQGNRISVPETSPPTTNPLLNRWIGEEGAGYSQPESLSFGMDTIITAIT